MEPETGHSHGVAASAGWKSPHALVPLLAGLVLLGALWGGPLPEMSRRAFSPHMILHLGVTVVAAPLIAIGLLNAGPASAGPRRPLLLAIAASMFELVVVWGWHAPAMHDAAAGRDAVFVAQQLSFLAAGLGIWTVSFGGNSRASAGIGVLAMMFTFMHMAMLGILLSLAPDLIYSPLYCLGAWGFDPLEDQRLGGALMAVFGGLPYLFGGIALAFRLLDE